MERFEHGGDIWGHPGALDFSANLSPLGMPEEVVAALQRDPRAFEAYPDPACRELVAGIAEALDVPAAWVLATAGATDLMSRVCLALRPARVLVTAPCYSGYEQAAEQAGASVVRHGLREEAGFAVGEGVLADVARLGGSGSEAGDLVILANPNNPTGLTVPLTFVERVVATAAKRGSAVLLDECFLDFAGAPSAVRLCASHPNLIVMRAFTKTYAMAGLRLGYGVCSDAELLGRVRDAGQPWALSTPAQVAGLAALRARELGYVEEARALVARERAWLSSELAALGFHVVPGEANYLLFRVSDEALAAGASADLCTELLSRGILIRCCENYEGLDALWFRIAVRTHEENGRLVSALRETVAGDEHDARSGGRRGVRHSGMGER